MLSVHDKDHHSRTEILAEANEVEECSLGELVDGDISKPDEKLLWGIFINAWEGPACLSAADPDTRINLKVLHLSFVQSEERLHNLALIYRI